MVKIKEIKRYVALRKIRRQRRVQNGERKSLRVRLRSFHGLKTIDIYILKKFLGTYFLQRF